MADDISSALVPFLLLVPIADWVVTAILIYLALSAHPRVAVLSERAIQAVVVSCVMTVFAVIFLNTETGRLMFDNEWSKAIGRLATLALGIAPIAWLVVYFRSAGETP